LAKDLNTIEECFSTSIFKKVVIMEEGDDFELMPREQIKKLKEELSRLRAATPGANEELLDGVKQLSAKLDSMTKVFESAEQDLMEEDKTAEIIKDKIDPILLKVTEIEDQNKKIAKGLVAINDILEEKLAELSEIVEDLKNIKPSAPEPRQEPREFQRTGIPQELSIGGTVPPPPERQPGEPVKLPFRKKLLFG
jgi:septation ring formation regulator EzrA